MGSRGRGIALDEVRHVFGRAERPGTPMTAAEVAEAVGCVRRTAHSKLQTLVDRGVLRTKKVGARGRVWWQPVEDARISADTETTSVQFRRLVDAVEEYGIFLLDPDGRVRSWNAGAERIKGYERDEILGEHFSAFYTETDREAGVPARNLAAARDGAVEAEGWRVRADGTRFWAAVTLTPIWGDDGGLQGFAKVTQDVTARREREQAVLAERNLFDRVLDTSPVGIGVFGRDGDPERVNRRFAELLGLPEEDAESYELGDTPLLDADGDSIPFEERPARRTLATGEPVTDQRVRVEGGDGRLRWLSIDTAPVERESGTGVVVAMADVTRLERQTRRLERQRDDLEAELAEVFDRVDDAFYALDDELRFTYLNERAEELLGRVETDLLDRYLWDAFERDELIDAAYRESLAAGEPTSIEVFYEPLDGWFEILIYPSDTGLSVYFRDVTGRVERERELEESEQRYRTLVENFPNGAVALLDDELRHTLVEGLGFENLDFSASDLRGERVEDFYPDDILAVIEPNYRAALEGESNSFELDVQGRTFEFRTLPLTTDDGDVFAGMVMSQDVTERKDRERELARQRQHLAALDDLNGVFREITDAVVDHSTREEVEATVCERLAAADSYSFAWIGEVDDQTRRVTLREEAGIEGYLDDVTISVDPDDEHSQGPTGQAIIDGETVVTQDVRADSSLDPWRDHVEAHDFRSSAAIPIQHDGTLYGVLNVYADRPRAFDDAEREVVSQLGEVVSQLGEVVGHAIAAIDRKRALMSDEVTELRFGIQDVFEMLDLSVPTDGRITFDEAVPIGDGVFLQYGTVTEDAIDALQTVTDVVPRWKQVSIRPPEDGVANFELRLDQPPVVSAVATVGGSIEETVIEDGDIRMTVHLSPTVEARRIIDVVEEAYPAVELVARRQTTRRRNPAERLSRAMTADLTDRQRAALDAAYHAGFFEWPREATGEDVAAALGITSSTFHQHLRAAQGKLLAGLYGDPGPATA